MGYEGEIINEFSESDIWKWVTYIDVFKWNETWKLKSFDNEKQIAYIVFKCNNNWDGEDWKDYTAQSCNYSNLSL